MFNQLGKLLGINNKNDNNSNKENKNEKNDKKSSNNYMKHFQPSPIDWVYDNNKNNYIGPLEISTKKEAESMMPSRYFLKDYGQGYDLDVSTESYLRGLKCNHSNRKGKKSGCTDTRAGEYKNGYYGRYLGGVERPLLGIPPSYIYTEGNFESINNKELGYYNVTQNKKSKCGLNDFKQHSINLELDNNVKIGADTRYR